MVGDPVTNASSEDGLRTLPSPENEYEVNKIIFTCQLATNLLGPEHNH